MLPPFEAIDYVSQTGRALGEVGGVDLSDVAQANNLGAGARAGDERFHLFGRKVLGFIDNHELI